MGTCARIFRTYWVQRLCVVREGGTDSTGGGGWRTVMCAWSKGWCAPTHQIEWRLGVGFEGECVVLCGRIADVWEACARGYSVCDEAMVGACMTLL